MWPWLCIIQSKWIPAVCCRGVVVSSDFFLFFFWVWMNIWIVSAYLWVYCSYWLSLTNHIDSVFVSDRIAIESVVVSLSLSHAHNIYESNYTAMHRIALIGLTNTQSIILRIKFKSLFFRFVSFILFWCFVAVAVVVFIIFLFLFSFSFFSWFFSLFVLRFLPFYFFHWYFSFFLNFHFIKRI